jgi:large subunit ribosomal protein L4
MPEIPVLGGTETVTVDDDVFGAPFNGPLVHEVVIADLAARRQGTHSTKTRGKVRGGGAKPWRQKGTGRARAGSSRSPIWVGGGTVFGPSPRHYTVKVNRKVRRAALRCALSLHAGRGSLAVVDAAAFQVPSTRRGVELLGPERKGKVVLVALGAEEAAAAKSFRNLERVHVAPADAIGIADLVRASQLVLSHAALTSLTERARKLDHRDGERAAAAIAASGPVAGSED